MDHFILFSSAIPQWIWGGGYALSIVCLLVAVVQILLPRRAPRWMVAVARLALAGILVLLAADSDGIWQAFSPWPPSPWLSVVAVSLCGIGLVVLSAQERWWGHHAAWRRWGAPVLLGTLAAASAASTVARFRSLDMQFVFETGRLQRQVNRGLIEVPDAIALTDMGRALPLFEFVPIPEDEQLDESDFGDGMLKRVILADESDSLANCHGWVFTGGRYLIRSALVDAILHDNGYRVTEEPLVDDLIIYRGGDGLPVHTGIVKATGKGGFILIESKWGGSHTYFHQPLDQVYSTSFAYYRSARQGHRLHLEPLSSGDAYRGEELPSWLEIPISAE